jgi:hypothetical protein
MWFGKEYTEEGTVELSYDQFIYLLDQWERLRLLKASEIVITLENGKLTIEGKSESNDTINH